MTKSKQKNSNNLIFNYLDEYSREIFNERFKTLRKNGEDGPIFTEELQKFMVFVRDEACLYLDQRLKSSLLIHTSDTINDDETNIKRQ